VKTKKRIDELKLMSLIKMNEAKMIKLVATNTDESRKKWMRLHEETGQLYKDIHELNMSEDLGEVNQ